MELLIKTMGSDGEGIAYYNKKLVYIYYAYLNELVDVDLILNKRGVYEGKLLKVIKPSKHRISNRIYHDANLFYLDYLETLNYKQSQMNYLMHKYLPNISKDIILKRIIKSPVTSNYRNKSDLPVLNINNKNRIGVYKRGSNFFIPINESVLDNNFINDTFKLILNLMDTYNINSYDRRKDSGSIVSLSVRSNLEGDLQVTFITKKEVDLTKISKELNKRNPKINSIYQNYVKNYKTNRDIYSGNLKLIFGEKYLNFKLDKYTFLLTPFSFFQLNSLQTINLYNLIITLGDFKKNEIVLDAYSGVGSIASFISPFVKRVVAVESIKSAVNDLNKSLSINNITNVRSIVGDIHKMHKYIKDKFDTVIFDPPRSGLSKPLINFIKNSKIKKIIYASCNPETLFRDLKIFNDTYKIVSITPIDMFPGTSQIESVALLTLK
ncbi:MAG: 23S rRNA (uracil(1939)-C(5))-methyltransferase RlmD [Acholeplasmataceae bacterium]